MGSEGYRCVGTGYKLECEGFGLSSTVPADLLGVVLVAEVVSSDDHKACFCRTAVCMLQHDAVFLVCLQLSRVCVIRFFYFNSLAIFVGDLNDFACKIRCLDRIEAGGDIAGKISICSKAHCREAHDHNGHGHGNTGKHHFFLHFSVLRYVEKISIKFLKPSSSFHRFSACYQFLICSALTVMPSSTSGTVSPR